MKVEQCCVSLVPAAMRWVLDGRTQRTRQPASDTKSSRQWRFGHSLMTAHPLLAFFGSLKVFPWSAGLKVTLSVVFAVLVGSASFARGENIADASHRMVMADSIERNYLDSLALENQSGAAAVQTMLTEGFRCRIEVAEEYVPGRSAMWYCVKRPSGNPLPCDELRVSLHFAPPSKIESARGALLENLENIKVTSARAFCPPPRFVGVAYLAARSTAEKSLASAIDALRLNTSGEAAYGKLLREGFYCGFAMPGKDVETPQLACTKLPSSIEFCFEAKVTLELTWPDGVRELKQLYSALPLARVTALRATCEIPALQPGRRAPI